jgi:hypothetical protein
MITKEELQSFSATDEGRAVLTEIGFIHGDQHKAILDEQIKGLADSKVKILSEKKSLEEKYKSIAPTVEAMDKFKKIIESHEITIDKDGMYDFNAIEDLIIKGKSGGAGGNTEELQKELNEYRRKHRDLDLEFKKTQSVYSKLETDNKTANEFIEKLLVEDEIRKELSKMDDLPKELYDSLCIVLKQRSGAIVEVDAENPTNRRAVTNEGDSIARFIELWKETPEGKTFRRAPQNTGGGSNHSSSNQSRGKEMLRSEFDTLSPEQQRSFFKSGGKLRD